MTPCNARADRYGTMRCVVCRVSWESDDTAACPRQAQPRELALVPEAEPFVSGLAPDLFARPASNKR